MLSGWRKPCPEVWTWSLRFLAGLPFSAGTKERTMENENGDFQGWPGVRQTLGEILPGGVVYELV